jgi:hypothetical protein
MSNDDHSKNVVHLSPQTLKQIARAGLLPIGSPVTFAERSGIVIGHTIAKRMSAADKHEMYYIVELDYESQGYLTHMRSFQVDNADCFISMMLVHVDNVNVP